MFVCLCVCMRVYFSCFCIPQPYPNHAITNLIVKLLSMTVLYSFFFFDNEIPQSSSKER